MITDRKSVISRLQIMHTWATFALEKDPSFFNEDHFKSIVEWTDNAIDLLKEPDSFVPYEFDVLWKCGNCGNGIVGIENDHFAKFCPMCGKKVKWK